MRSRTLSVSLLCLPVRCCPAASAPAQQTRHEADRVIAAVDTQQRQTLGGHLPPWAAPEDDLGAVGTDLALDHLTVVLARSAATQAAFEQFLNDQQNPGSPHYQQWLTPQQIGEQFGLTDHDVQAVTRGSPRRGCAWTPSRPTARASPSAAPAAAVGARAGHGVPPLQGLTGRGEQERALHQQRADSTRCAGSGDRGLPWSLRKSTSSRRACIPIASPLARAAISHPHRE